MARSVSFIIEAEVLTEITITENDNGTLTFSVNVLEGGLIGDLRALFFDLNGLTSDVGLSVFGGTEITDSVFAEEGVDSLGRDANINGSVVNELGDFDVGIEFGTSGIAEDDIQSTTFTLAHDTLALNLDMIDLADFGVRYTSVGEDGGARNDSVKAGESAAGVASNDALLVLENQAGSVDLLANDTEGAGATVTGVSDAGGVFAVVPGGFERAVVLGGLSLGTLFVGADGVASFAADGADADVLFEGETLVLQFTYATVVPDGSTATADVSLTVQGVNDAPTLADGALSADEDGAAVTLDLSALGGDVDGDDDGTTLTYSLVGAPAEGSASISGTVLSFDPGTDFQDLNDGETRDVLLTVQATDAHGASVTATVTVTVEGADDNVAPRFTISQAARLDEANEPALLSATGVMEFSDANLGDRPVVTVQFWDAGWSKGPNTLTPAQKAALDTGLTLVPDPGNTNAGSVAFTYEIAAATLDFLAEGESLSVYYQARVTDEAGLSDTTLAGIHITGTNDAPVITSGSTSPGDPDIVWAQSSNAGNFTALNDGNGFFQDGVNLYQQSRLVDVSLGDLDGDGDLDIFASAGSSGNAALLNDGSGNFSPNGQINLAVGHNMENVLGDLDGDGDLDVFLVRQSGSSSVILFNDGTGQFADSGQFLATDHSAGVDLGDLDGDGDLDAFIANFVDQGNRVVLNDGSGVFTDSGQSLGDDNSFAVRLGDVDGDGDLDAVVANGHFQTGEANRVYLNDGTGVFADSGQALGQGDSQDVALADVNGDGDLDAVFANRGPTGTANRLYLNNGAGVFTDSGQLIGSDHSYAVAFADLDVDGDQDLVVGNYDPNTLNLVGSSVNRIYFNDGTGVFTDSGQEIASVVTSAIAIGDLDSDGPTAFAGQVTELPDGDAGENVEVHGASGTIAFTDVDISDTHTASYAATGGGYLGTFVVGAPTTTADTDSGVLDWTFEVDDAALDYLAAGEVLTQTYAVTISDGHGGTATSEVSITITGAQDATPIAAEPFNMIATGTSGGARILSVAQDGTLAQVDFLANNGGFAYGTAVGDINGDGLDDVFMSGDWSGAVIHYADGAGGFTNAGVTLPGQFQSRVEIADIDNDGDGDLYVQNGLGAAEVWRNDAGSFTNVLSYTDISSGGSYRTASHGIFEDVNGDGAVDLLINRVNDSLPISDVLFLNDGAGNFSASGMVLPTLAGFATPELADVNGDGAADYVVGTASGLFAALNDGTGTFVTSETDLGPAFNGHVALADFNGDGFLDALRNDPDAGTGLELWLGNGTDDFVFDSVIAAVSPAYGGGFSVGDYSGDGIADVVQVGNGVVRTLVNDGTGTFVEDDALALSGFIFGEDLGLL